MNSLQSFCLTTILVFSIASPSHSLDNGLARTPPMGWMTWQRYRCQIDCKLYPNDCISEDLIKRTADRLVEDGFAELGYKYVVIDDCWPMRSRDRHTSKLVPDADRFPEGLEKLEKYLHDRNLYFGIYLDYGTFTCERYPGSMDYLELDATTLADWKVDYVKMDGCYAPLDRMPGGYEDFAVYLQATGRPMVFSCSYPAYIDWRKNHSAIDWERLKKNCNLWRMLWDVNDSWGSVSGIINAIREHAALLTPLAGPGHWNDPDMLVLGNFGLSHDQERVQMGMWCMFAAPLLLSTEMDNLNAESAKLIKNKLLIAIDQDAGGHSAQYIGNRGSIQLWTRQLTRTAHSWAIALVNMASGAYPIHLSITLKEMQIPSEHPDSDIFELVDVFTGEQFGVLQHTDPVIIHVNPTGIAMYHVQLRIN